MASSIHSTTQCRLPLPPAQRANVIQNDLTSQGQNCFPSSGGTPLFSSSSAPTSPHPNTDCLLLLFKPLFFPCPTDSLLHFFGSAGAPSVPALRTTGINRSNKGFLKIIQLIEVKLLTYITGNCRESSNSAEELLLKVLYCITMLCYSV